MPGPWSATWIRTSGPARPAVTVTTPPSGLCASALATTLRSARARCPGSAQAIDPGSTATSMRADRSRRWPVERERDLGDRDGRDRPADGRAWSGAASARARSSISATTPPSAAAVERAASRPAGIGRDDAVDHRLELGFEDGGGRREVVGDVAGRAPAEHLRSLEAVGHGVERVGQLGRLAVVAARRPRARFARLEPSRGGRHVVQRAGQPAGDPGRHEHDPEHADQARDRERDVEQPQEARGRPRAPARRPRASPRACRRPRSASRSAPDRRSGPGRTRRGSSRRCR